MRSIVQPANTVNELTITNVPDYVVFIIMENQSNSTILNSAPYMSQLATQYSLPVHYQAITHPSLPNYYGLFTGSVYCSASPANTPGCIPECTFHDYTPSQCPSNAPNIVDSLEKAEKSWKAYMEDMPGVNGCASRAANDSGLYVAHHNPFLYFNDIKTVTARCQRIVPAGLNDNNLINDLNSVNTASNFMWLTPNVCNDMHWDNACPNSNPVSYGDNYLKNLVPRILQSPVFTTRHAALFLTFDEGTNDPNYVYSVWAGPVVKTNYRSDIGYTHYSFLHTLEKIWNMPPIATGDSSANDMYEFFTTFHPIPPTIDFTWTPQYPFTNQSVTFTATVSGGTQPYYYTWMINGSTNATGRSTLSHSIVHFTFPRVGTYNVTVNVEDSYNLTSHVSKIVTVAQAPYNIKTSFQYTPSTPDNKTVITFTATASGGFEPYSYSWNFGDGNNATGSSVQHTYRLAGNYNVTLTSMDKNLYVATSSKNISIAKAPSITCPPPCFTWPPPLAVLPWYWVGAGGLALAVMGTVLAVAIRRYRK
jgi:PKD repeat protein